MDFNGDGRLDILCGERGKAPGAKVFYFSRNEDGTLHAEGAFPGVIVTWSSAPAVCDWNDDGKMDFILGQQGTFPDKGTMFIWLNSGTNAEPKMGGGHALLDDANQWIDHFRCMPQVFDLDNDGMKEVIVGEADGKIYFHENVGSKNAPKIKQGVAIPGLEVEYDSKFSICDWNEDGHWDFVVGSGEKDLLLFLGNNGKVANNNIQHDVIFNSSISYQISGNTLSLQMSDKNIVVDKASLLNCKGQVIEKINTSSTTNFQSMRFNKPKTVGIYFVNIITNKGTFNRKISLF